MKLPPGWTPERASGWWSLHYLTHERCGWTSGMAYDLVLDDNAARQVVYGHECEDEREARETREASDAEVAGLREKVAALTAEVARVTAETGTAPAHASSADGGG